MSILKHYRSRIYCFLLLSLCFIAPGLPFPASGQCPQGIIRGRALDPRGDAIPYAKATLLQKSTVVESQTTDQGGHFEFSAVKSGRYYVRVEATGFQTSESEAAYLPTEGTLDIELTLPIGTLRQQFVVSATGSELSASQVGASLSVIDRQELEAVNKLDLFEAMRLVPGAQIVQTGQRGGPTSLFLRGGNANFNKVLIDGIPANDIGGGFNFANFSIGGVEQLELLRSPNSVLYGVDSLGSVVNVTTRRGASSLPEFTYSADGGNYRTFRQQASLAGAFRQFDYFSDFSRFDTHNSLPNNAFHNGTYTGNFGWKATRATDVRLTVRHTTSAVGLPNALDFFGIADDSSQRARTTHLGITAQNQTTARWHNRVRFASSRLKSRFTNPSPSGEAFDPFGFGANFLGNQVTIRGANGLSMTGRAILDFGDAYPQLFDVNTTRQSLYAQSDYSLKPDLTATFGFRFEYARGFTKASGSPSPTERKNFSYSLQTHGRIWRRAYLTAGVGLEDNAVFGFAATPRVSLAFYLRQGSGDAFFSDTKLRLNFGTGIKEPSIFHEGSSLFRLLSGLTNGSSLISQFGVSSIGPERSRSFDFGFDQGLGDGRARLGVTFFHNRFFDLIEFVSKDVLPQLGVPTAAAAATSFGATINSSSFRALGVETEFVAQLKNGFRLQGEYTYLGAVVTESFSSGALQPAINPAFPGIPIGAFSPLVGNRPFRRAPHSGSLVVGYSKRNFGLTLSGYFVGRQDGSSFLSDPFFGNSLLLPNRNFNSGYQKLDWSGRYSMNRVITIYTSIENLLSQRYQPAPGFPASPFTFRTGVKIRLGGEGWR